MMNLKLPNFVFKKKYDNYFLFTEFDIIHNEEFYERFISFIGQIGGRKLVIEFTYGSSNRDLPVHTIEYLNPNVGNLIDFYNMDMESCGDVFPVYNLNHTFRDDDCEWELYVSLENELSVFGCNQSVVLAFLKTIRPYEEEQLSIKKKIIGDMFSDETARRVYLDALEKNYNFSKATTL